MSPSEEHEWVLQAQQGDRAAFGRLVERYWKPLRRWLHGLVGQAEWAEDIAQETFLKAWSHLPGLQQTGTFRTWLFRIAGNHYFNQRRGPRGKETEPLSPGLPSREESPLEGVLDRERQTKLEQAIRQLPEDFRAAYLLFSQEEMAYPDIAQVLQIAEPTARWRVCKARKLLVRRLAEYLERPSS